MTSQKEHKDRITLDAAYAGLKWLLREHSAHIGSGTKPSDIARFDPPLGKKYPSAYKAAMRDLSWVEPYVSKLVESGLVNRLNGDLIAVADHTKLEAVIKAHEEGEAVLSDLVFKSGVVILDDEDEEEAPELENSNDPIMLLVDTVVGIAGSVTLLRTEVQRLSEEIQGTNKRIGAQEKQLEAALGVLNGVIRTVQQVDSAKILREVSEGFIGQKAAHATVFKLITQLGEEVRGFRLVSDTIMADLKAREADKLGRAVRDLKDLTDSSKAVLDLLLEARSA